MNLKQLAKYIYARVEEEKVLLDLPDNQKYANISDQYLIGKYTAHMDILAFIALFDEEKANEQH